MTGPPVAIVTGANRGIGFEVARGLAGLGHAVVLCARDPEDGEAAVRRIRAEGGDVVAQRLDVTDRGSVDALFASIRDRHRRLDVLINNAGAFYDPDREVLDPDLELAAAAFDTNALGPWRMALGAVPLMRASGGGRIVNVSSGSGSLADMGSDSPGYGISKAALNALTRKLAAAVRGSGILVNSVCPGWVATEMTGGAGSRTPAEGARSVLWAVQIPDDGPSGGFFRDGRPLPW